MKSRRWDPWLRRLKPCGSMTGLRKQLPAARGWSPVAGGGGRGGLYMPAVVADVHPDMRISRDELFGPAVAVTPFDTIEEALTLANDSVYGLAAGIFTADVEWAMKFAR